MSPMAWMDLGVQFLGNMRSGMGLRRDLASARGLPVQEAWFASIGGRAPTNSS